MYGNSPVAGEGADRPELSTPQRRRLRRDLAGVAARTRELLPDEYAVGLDLSEGVGGVRAAVAVEPPVGSVVSAGYAPADGADHRIDDDERDDLARGLAASAALQVKQAVSGSVSQTAQ